MMATDARWFDVLLHDYVRECVRRVDGRVISHQHVDLGAWDHVERWRPRTGFSTPGRDPWRAGPGTPTARATRDLVRRCVGAPRHDARFF